MTDTKARNAKPTDKQYKLYREPDRLMQKALLILGQGLGIRF